MGDSIPTERDFLEDHGCLDARCAWENFGGLSLDEAFKKFCENPLSYGEDFMFMGEFAFAYYFPVLDRYVREAIRDFDEERLEDLMYVRDAIWFHFAECFEEVATERIRKRDLADGGCLRKQVIDLCEHVIQEAPRLCLGSRPSSGITEGGVLLVWRGLLRLAKGE